MTDRSVRALTLGLLATSALASPAFAQTPAPADATPATPTTQSPAPGTNATDVTSPPEPVKQAQAARGVPDETEIIITATKREENLQNVPISVQAIGTRRLDRKCHPRQSGCTGHRRLALGGIRQRPRRPAHADEQLRLLPRRGRLVDRRTLVQLEPGRRPDRLRLVAVCRRRGRREQCARRDRAADEEGDRVGDVAPRDVLRGRSAISHQVYPPALTCELSTALSVAPDDPFRFLSLKRVMYLSAAIAAVVASPDAVVTWRVSCARRSPAATF